MVLHYRHRLDDGFYSMEPLGYSKYAISREGEVRADFGTKRPIKVGYNRHRDPQVQMTNDDGIRRNVKLDTLLAEAFIEKPQDTRAFNTVIHKNGDKGDNRLDNLVWRSRSYAHLYYKHVKDPGRYSDRCYITAHNRTTRETKRYLSVAEAAQDFGVYPYTMNALCEPEYYLERSIYVDDDWEFEKQRPFQI